MKERIEKSTPSCLSCRHFRFKVYSEEKAKAKCVRPNMESVLKGDKWKTACFARETVYNDRQLWKNFHQIKLYGDLLGE